MTTYQEEPAMPPRTDFSVALLCAILRDLAIVLAVIVYCIDTLD